PAAPVRGGQGTGDQRQPLALRAGCYDGSEGLQPPRALADSSAGRARPLQGRGRRFDPSSAYQPNSRNTHISTAVHTLKIGRVDAPTQAKLRALAPVHTWKCTSSEVSV